MAAWNLQSIPLNSTLRERMRRFDPPQRTRCPRRWRSRWEEPRSRYQRQSTRSALPPSAGSPSSREGADQTLSCWLKIACRLVLLTDRSPGCSSHRETSRPKDCANRCDTRTVSACVSPYCRFLRCDRQKCHELHRRRIAVCLRAPPGFPRLPGFVQRVLRREVSFVGFKLFQESSRAW